MCFAEQAWQSFGTFRWRGRGVVWWHIAGGPLAWAPKAGGEGDGEEGGTRREKKMPEFFFTNQMEGKRSKGKATDRGPSAQTTRGPQPGKDRKRENGIHNSSFVF